MSRFIFVGLGGALGAICRYSISFIPVKTNFPILTLLINFMGAIVIGFITALFANGVLSGGWTLFWKTGVCGGFTTFSTFSLEAWNLFESRNFARGGIYVFLSVGLCLAGVAVGLWIGKTFQKTLH